MSQLNDEILTLNREIDRLDNEIQELNCEIGRLEDELKQANFHADDALEAVTMISADIVKAIDLLKSAFTAGAAFGAESMDSCNESHRTIAFKEWAKQVMTPEPSGN